MNKYITAPAELVKTFMALVDEDRGMKVDLIYIMEQACSELGIRHILPTIPEQSILQEIISKGLSVVEPDSIYSPLPDEPTDADKITDSTAWFHLLEHKYFYCAVVALTVYKFSYYSDSPFPYYSPITRVFLRVDYRHFLSEKALKCTSIFTQTWHTHQLHSVTPIYAPPERIYWDLSKQKYYRDYLEWGYGSVDCAATYYTRREDKIT